MTINRRVFLKYALTLAGAVALSGPVSNAFGYLAPVAQATKETLIIGRYKGGIVEALEYDKDTLKVTDYIITNPTRRRVKVDVAGLPELKIDSSDEFVRKNIQVIARRPTLEWVTISERDERFLEVLTYPGRIETVVRHR